MAAFYADVGFGSPRAASDRPEADPPKSPVVLTPRLVVPALPDAQPVPAPPISDSVAPRGPREDAAVDPLEFEKFL